MGRRLDADCKKGNYLLTKEDPMDFVPNLTQTRCHRFAHKCPHASAQARKRASACVCLLALALALAFALAYSLVSACELAFAFVFAFALSASWVSQQRIVTIGCPSRAWKPFGRVARRGRCLVRVYQD